MTESIQFSLQTVFKISAPNYWHSQVNTRLSSENKYLHHTIQYQTASVRYQTVAGKQEPQSRSVSEILARVMHTPLVIHPVYVTSLNCPLSSLIENKAG